MNSKSVSTQELLEAKKAMRAEMIQRRTLAKATHPDAAMKLRDQILSSIPFPKHSCVSLFMAQGDEINPTKLGEALVGRGHTLCLPVVMAKHTPLQFRAYTPGDNLVPGVWDIPQPPATAKIVQPDVLIVPLLAFDKRGYRLGYGGGYYDRTLAALRATRKIMAIGIGFAVQEVPLVPTHEFDAKLDVIVTESSTIWPTNAAPSPQ